MRNHHHNILIQSSGLECRQKSLLRLEDPGGCANTAIFLSHSRNLHDRPTEISFDQTETPSLLKRLITASDHIAASTDLQRAAI